MSCSSGPQISTNSLVLSIDQDNIKSYPYHPSPNDHGISDWYCFANATVTYSCSEPNTAIYQIDTSNNITTIVSTNSLPQRGTFNAYFGYRYYGNNPINLVAEEVQHSIAPITMASNTFIYVANRVGSESGNVYVYSPYDTANVVMYKGYPGVNGTPNTYITLSKGQQNNFGISNLDYYYFTSNSPVLMTAAQISVDKTILSPAKKTMYQRFINHYVTLIGTTPSSIQNYAISDTTYPVLSQSIADGAGGDTTQGLGYENLCDRYSWGNVLSDYLIAAPLDNTIVTTYYWDTTNTSWKMWESHNITGGTLTIPNAVLRDGTIGVGNSAANITGLANNMANEATLWKWEGNNPFYLCINDSYDDEFSVLGWMSNKNYRTVSDLDNKIYDLSGLNNNGLIYNKVYNYSYFDGLNDYISIPFNSNMTFDYEQTIILWLKPTESDANRRNPYNQAYGGAGTITHEPDGYFSYYYGTAGINSTPYTGFGNGVKVLQNETAQVVITRNPYITTWYKNGYTTASQANPYGKITTGTQPILIGNGYAGYYMGYIYSAQVFNRCLTDDEILQNYNALKGRFGI